MSRAVRDRDEPLPMATTDLSPERPTRQGSSSRGLAQEGGLPELFDAIRWRWRPTTLIALLFFLGATFYVERLPAQYDGIALIAISPDPSSPNSGADTVRVGAPKYVEYVNALATIRRVALRLGENEQTLRNAVGAHLATDTGNVTITVRLPSPFRAARAANAFADSTLVYRKIRQAARCRVHSSGASSQRPGRTAAAPARGGRAPRRPDARHRRLAAPRARAAARAHAGANWLAPAVIRSSAASRPRAPCARARPKRSRTSRRRQPSGSCAPTSSPSCARGMWT